jgi:hypothetical protein
MWKARTFC